MVAEVITEREPEGREMEGREMEGREMQCHDSEY